MRGARQRKPSREVATETVLGMEEIAARLAEVARPMVRKFLDRELTEVGASAWEQEAQQTLRLLLGDENALQQAEGDLGRQAALQEALRDGLERADAADEEELDLHAAEVGQVMASAWFQLLVLALEGKEALRLEANLLPTPDDAPMELWEALQGSLAALPVGADDAPTIMEGFAADCLARARTVRLPLGLVLEVQRGRSPSYLVRRAAAPTG